MHYRPIGTSGIEASTIALGTWTFAGDAIWGPSEANACVRVVHAALDRGITFFDTAPNYGNGRSEEVLGQALSEGASSVISNTIVATKFKIDETTPPDLRRKVLASIKRLRRDRIDLVQIHWPGATSDETKKAAETLLSLRDEGLIREVGVCNFGLFDLADIESYPIVSNQIPYNLLWRAIEGEEGIAAQSRKAGCATIAYSVLQQGLLTGQYISLDDFPVGRKRTRHFGQEWPGIRHTEKGLEAETAAALQGITAIAAASGRSVLELSLGFVTGAKDIDVTLIGARTEDQLARSCAAAEISLSFDERRSLEEATEPLRSAIGGHPDMYLSESRIRFPDEAGRPVRKIGEK